MITGEVKNKVDDIWNDFWTNGISNPLTVIEQLTYLLFIKRLDEIQNQKELKSNRTGKKIDSPIYSPSQKDLRWSSFKNKTGSEIHKLMTTNDGAFEFIKKIGTGPESTFSTFMKDATYLMNSKILGKVIDKIDQLPLEDKDSKGDLYEYLLSKLSTAGKNGQFRTPRHIIKTMVSMLEPRVDDTICDPACGSAGFLVAAVEFLIEHTNILHDKKLKTHFQNSMFYGNDFDQSMIRIGAMNLMLHGIENPCLKRADSLEEECANIQNKYSLIYANPPFKGSLDYESTASNLLSLVKTKKTELLFLALILRELKVGGRAAVVVPEGVLFSSSKAHKEIRKTLIEQHKLTAVISMPSGVFKPYANVSTAILIFTKTNTGGTDNVWFYGLTGDGFSLDDKRIVIKDPTHEQDNLPDLITRFKSLDKESSRARTEQSFMVPVSEIVNNEYDLSFNLYKEIESENIKLPDPKVVINEMNKNQTSIHELLKELEKGL